MKFNIFQEKINIFEENNDKEKILFLHGFSSNYQVINPIRKLEHNFDIVSFDFPGCGGSSMNTDSASLEYYTEIAIQFIKQYKHKFKWVFAHSMGAHIALKLIDLNIIEKAILISPLSYMISNDNINIAKNLLPQTVEESKQSLINLFYNVPANLLKVLDKQAQSNLNYVSKRYSYYKSLVFNEITNPTYLKEQTKNIWKQKNKDIFLIVGEDDNYTPVEKITKLAKDNNIKLKVIPNAGHAIFVEGALTLKNTIEAIINTN